MRIYIQVNTLFTNFFVIGQVLGVRIFFNHILWCFLMINLNFSEILDDLDNRIDETDQRVRSETNNITIVDRKDNTCMYWVIIILLFISIVVVAVI